MFLLSVSCKCWFLSLITEKCNSVKCVNSSPLPFYFQKSGKGNWEWTKKLPLWLEGFKMVLIWGALLPTKYADILVLTNPLPQCSWGTSPGGGSLLFVFYLSSDSKQNMFFIPNHAEWEKDIWSLSCTVPVLKEKSWYIFTPSWIKNVSIRKKTCFH